MLRSLRKITSDEGAKPKRTPTSIITLVIKSSTYVNSVLKVSYT